MKFPLSDTDKAQCDKHVQAVLDSVMAKPTLGAVWQLYTFVGGRGLETISMLPVYVLNTSEGFKFFESKERAEAMKIFFI